MPTNECNAPDCTRQRAGGSEWCVPHKRRMDNFGDLMLDVPIRMGRPPKNDNAECSIEGCDRPVLARDLCSAHYQRTTKGYQQPIDTPVRMRSSWKRS